MRVYLDAVILKFSGEEQVTLLSSHMIRLVKEEKLLSLALTTDPTANLNVWHENQ